MEPLSAFSVAANVIQLVDFTSKLVSGAHEIYESADEELIEHSELKAVTKNLSRLTREFDTSIKARKLDRKQFSENELEQERLGKDCSRVASELLEALDRLKFHGKHAKWNSVRQALLSVWHKDKIDTLEKRLERFRQELVANTLATLR